MDPRSTHRERLELWNGREESIRALEGRLIRARLLLFALAIVLAWFSFVRSDLPGWASLPALAGFVAVLVIHARKRRARAHAARAAAFHQAAIDRMDGKWAASPHDGRRFADGHHPFSGDLDLFGPGSVFQRISTCRTGLGEEKLAGWLLVPAPHGVATARQESVRELGPAIELRESIALTGVEARKGVESNALHAWVSSPPVTFTAAERVSAWILSTVAALALIVWIPAFFTSLLAPAGLGQASALASGVLLFSIVGVWLFSARLGGRVAAALEHVESAELDLERLSAILGIIERTRFESPSLRELQQSLRVDGALPSERIDSLARLVALLDSRRNQFFFPIAALILWTTHIAFAVERWRTEAGSAVLRWTDAVAEIEALSALGAFHFENPDYPFPRFVDGPPRLEARQLGHPLIEPSRLVRNDLSLGGETSLLLVSGSNMSGKSTLLRSAGLAAVLAQAGAPVCAESLEITPLSVGASIRIHDSLQEGASRFWAEITRLKEIAALSRGERPLLFLLDELLAGTNSHDRRIGAEAVLRRLIEAGSIGLATTHDLALTSIAETSGGRARNVHFEDRIDGDSVVFDYRMREGVVTRSNALALMKMVGLVGD
ncbi:MAG: DNA mismatch repair protein MutS [Thermoanaerobaculia bacterium]